MQISKRSGDDAVVAEIGRRVRDWRLRRNVTQADLAHEAGVTRLTVSRLEHGDGSTLTTLARVLRALDLLEHLDRAVPPTPPSPIAAVEREGTRRQRASTTQRTDTPAPPWRWGDEEPDGEP